jgi:hypothetical protein
MIIYFLERIRKFFKSIGKKEEVIDNLITYRKFKKNIKNYQLFEKDFYPEKEVEKPFKIAATITFYYDKNKLSNLIKVCESLKLISNDNEIYIFTNKINSNQEQELKNSFKNKAQILMVDPTINDRLLPWYHLNLMKKLFIKDDITHFVYLEDDILLNKSNFNYWVNSRKILKKFNLIPGLIRTEVDKNDNQLYAVDFTKNNKLSNLPKITVNDDYYFVNHKFPYQGMYLYDRELMKEHLFGHSSNPDCGHGAYNTDYINKEMINLDLMAKANIGLTYMNVPHGFFNRIVTLYNRKNCIIDSACQIQHLSNKYSNSKSLFGSIKIKDVLK